MTDMKAQARAEAFARRAVAHAAGQGQAAEILAAYFPGTRAGVSAQEIPWRKGSGERVELWLSGTANEQQVLPRRCFVTLQEWLRVVTSSRTRP